jgi:ABC-type transporter MlaC component
VTFAQNLWPLEANPAPHAETNSPASWKLVVTDEKRQPASTARQAAALKAKPPTKRVATKKSTPPKRVTAAKKAEPTTVAKAKKAEPTKVATAAAKPAPSSSPITANRDNVTTTTTRVVPLPATLAAAMVPVAAPAPAKPVDARNAEPKPASTAVVATPVSLTQPVAAPAPVKSAEARSAEPQPAAPVVVATPVSVTQPAAAAPRMAALAATAVAPLPATPAAGTRASGTTQPSDPKAAASFVSNFLGEAFRLAKSDGTSLQRRARLADLFAHTIDVTRIAGYTTGNELSGVSSDIQQRFRTILVSYLVETYYPQLELASDPMVRVETAPVEPLADGTAVVWTTFAKDGWGSQSVKWHLANEDGHYRIVDIFSAGASLVQMERDTFFSVMRYGGLNELMAKLDQRTKELATAATN